MQTLIFMFFFFIDIFYQLDRVLHPPSSYEVGFHQIVHLNFSFSN